MNDEKKPESFQNIMTDSLPAAGEEPKGMLARGLYKLGFTTNAAEVTSTIIIGIIGAALCKLATILGVLPAV